MKFYIASLFSEISETRGKVKIIEKQLGWECVADWVFGGEEGLSRSEIAFKDLSDVQRSDYFILISHPYGTKLKGGGRWVEMGYALAYKIPCAVIGSYENVFCHHLDVDVYPTIQDFILDNKVM